MQEDDESLGTKPKFWFLRDGQRWLFKEARENTGEDWAEKLAAEIAAKLDIPAAFVMLASFQGKAGSASLSFLDPEKRSIHLIHGNEILAGQVFGYDKDKRHGQSEHALENIEFAIRKLFPVPEHHEAVLTQLATYLVLDGLIGNVDRHHENWGLLSRFTEQAWEISVAPSYDHASSLGRELHDAKRRSILANNRMEQYIRKGRGGIYLSSKYGHGANPLRLVEFGARWWPGYFAPTLDRVVQIPVKELLALIDRVPIDRMSFVARSFAKALLTYTHSSLCTLNP
jgi:hypothetical protein